MTQNNKNVNPLFTKFMRFSGVGVIGTSVHYATLVFLVNVLDTGAVKASSAGFLAGAVTNYLLNYHYTFSSKKRHRETMSKFIIVALIGLFLNGLIMSFCTSSLKLHYLIAQVIATGLVLLWNFTVNHKWTFHEHKNNNAENSVGK